MRFATRALHSATETGETSAPVAPAIYQSATFEWEDLGEFPQYQYTRYDNPTRKALEQTVAALEGARYAVSYASGMAAMHAALTLLKAGDHFLVARDIYGGTNKISHTLMEQFGVSHSLYNSLNPCELKEKVTGQTKLVVFEGPTNPTLRIVDIKATVAVARELGLTTVFDNTFASPALQNPLELGVDLVMHSTTKYIGGHSDIIGGMLVTNREDIHQTVLKTAMAAGGVPSPFDCWLALRGVKTLQVRMRQHCEGAMAVASALKAHKRVVKVNYPGLPDHPEHQLAKRQMRGFGGMLSFELNGSGKDAENLAKKLKIFKVAPSLGGVESLVGYPKMMSHVSLTPEERLARDIPDSLLRLSIGLEDPEDLIEDLQQALR